MPVPILQAVSQGMAGLVLTKSILHYLLRGRISNMPAITELPTSNADIVPTVLAIYNLPKPAGMDGRAVAELLPKASENEHYFPKASCQNGGFLSGGGTYKLSAESLFWGIINISIMPKQNERRPVDRPGVLECEF